MTQSSTDSSLVERLRYRVNNPSAWDSFDQAASDEIAESASRISTLERELEDARAKVEQLRGETYLASAEAAEFHRDNAVTMWNAERARAEAAEAKVARMGEALPSDDKWQLLLSAAENLRGGSSDPERKVEATWRIAYELAKWAAQIDAARFALQPEKDREGEDGR